MLFGPSSAGTMEEGRFPAGTVLAGRYRVLGLIGHGGMGEVYRAYDLILNQAVALKFLSRSNTDEAALARFRNEVRIARQVSHPNVCRVYDIGFVASGDGGFHFLSMEYLDGEDLASLIRRIGRLPQDKSIEFARKICSGLAAAHERGVLHRDLKPANIMIDGRGQVRITDFGLAALAQEVALRDIRNGTPAYMSPEQKAGKEVTTRSDLYSLGLVLYEMFTGKRRSDTQTDPTELVKGFDPAVERVILRCLEQDPKRRPPSALNVAMALPGGDPIAAALAGGETPSPEMVAASGEKEGFSPRTAWLLLAAVTLAVVLSMFLSAKTSLLTRERVDIPPDALAFKAQLLLKQFGYAETPVRTAYGFVCCNQADLRDLDKLAPKRDELFASGQSGIVGFWYRQHQDEFFTDQFLFDDPFPTTGIVSVNTPPNTEPGMIRTVLGTDGRLQVLEAVAKEAPGEAAPPKAGSDAAALFAAAGLDYSRFAPSAHVRIPPVPFDQRMTWVGTYGEGRPGPVTVQAAWWRGKPVYFRSNEAPPAFQQPTGAWVQLGLFVAMLIGGVAIARRNFQVGRGDRAGAARLAALTFLLAMLSWLLTAQHVAHPYEILLLVRQISWALFLAGALWCLYMAVEPSVRRHWPDSLISWTQVLQGRLHSPLVASHVLAGVAVAAGAWTVQLSLQELTSAVFLKGSVAIPSLTSGSLAAAVLTFSVYSSLFLTMGLLVLLTVARLAFRRAWIADFAVALLMGVAFGLGPGAYRTAAIIGGWWIVLSLAWLWLFRRFGLLSFATAGFIIAAEVSLPIVWSSWYVGRALALQLMPAAMAAWALWVILSAQRQMASESSA